MILYFARGNGKPKQLYVDFINKIIEEHPEAEKDVEHIFKVINEESTSENTDLDDYVNLSIICELLYEKYCKEK